MGRRGAEAGPDLSRTSTAASERGRLTEAEYFDELVSREGEFNPFTDRGWLVVAQAFRRLLDVGEGAADAAPCARPGGRILDVGCGTGESRRVYAGTVSHYQGADLSIAAVIRAGRAHPEHRWLAADAVALPVGDDALDLVSFSSVLHHLPTPAAALGEARRVVKPGGWVFAFDPNLLHPPMALFRHPASPLYRPAGVSPHERPVLPGEVRAWFREAGLVDVRQRCRSGIAYRRVAPPLLDRLLGLYNLADAALQALGLGRWLGSFVLTAARKEA